MKAQVAALYTHDSQVGADMTNATAGEGKIQFVDHTFKTDNNGQDQPTLGDERPMPDVGGEHIGGGGGQTPLEEGLGGPPGPPADWWKGTPSPAPPGFDLKEFEGDVLKTSGAVAGEASIAASLPAEGPMLPVGIVGLIAGANVIGDDLEKVVGDIEKGIG